MSEIVTRPALPEDEILLRRAVAAKGCIDEDAAIKYLTDLKSRLENNGALLLAEVDSHLAGFIAFCVKGDKEASLASLEGISVLPEYEALPIDRILKTAARQHLETLHIKGLQLPPQFLTDSEKLSLPRLSNSREIPALGAEGKEINGSKGPEPTRYGDWEHNGRCTDF